MYVVQLSKENPRLLFPFDLAEGGVVAHDGRVLVNQCILLLNFVFGCFQLHFDEVFSFPLWLCNFKEDVLQQIAILEVSRKYILQIINAEASQ